MCLTPITIPITPSGLPDVWRKMVQIQARILELCFVSAPEKRIGIDELIKAPLFIIGAVTFFFVHLQQKMLKRRSVAPSRFSSSFSSLITTRFAVRYFMDFHVG